MSYGDPTILSSLADLLPSIVGQLPGCPPVAIRQQMQETAEDFCRYTGALRAIVGPFDFTADVKTYMIELPILAVVNQVHRLYIYNVEQHPSTYQVSLNSDCATVITFTSTPSSTLTGAWTADVSMNPHKGCEDFPSYFLSQWGHAIVAGTLAELMEDSTKRWNNPVKAQRNAQKYSIAKQDAAFRRLQGSSKDGRLSFQNDESFAGGFY